MIIIALICAVGSIASAGTFTIVLIPIGVIALLAAATSFWGARRFGLKAATHSDAGVTDTVTRSGDVGSESADGRVPATADELLDARRAA